MYQIKELDQKGYLDPYSKKSPVLLTERQKSYGGGKFQKVTLRNQQKSSTERKY